MIRVDFLPDRRVVTTKEYDHFHIVHTPFYDLLNAMQNYNIVSLKTTAYKFS